MKKEIKPVQAAIAVVVLLLLVLGVGWYIMDGSQQKYVSMPPAASRSEMLSHIHSAGPSGGGSDSGGASAPAKAPVSSGPPMGIQKTD